MLYDRPYMRYQENRLEVPALKWILIANIAVFLLSEILLRWFVSAFAFQYFSLSWENIRSGFLWTIGTYSLLHASFAHILFNMLIIYFVGRALQIRLGGDKLLELYIVATLVGAFAWLAFNLTSEGLVVGASAAATGLITVFCLKHYYERLTLLLFFIIPISATGRQILLFLLCWEGIGLLFFELGPATELWPLFFDGIAYSAHLGGLAGGFLFERYLSRRESIFKRKGPLIKVPAWFRKRNRKPKPKQNYSVNITNRRELQSEVDRILDKINSQGFGSLKEEEKRTLDRARDLLNR